MKVKTKPELIKEIEELKVDLQASNYEVNCLQDSVEALEGEISEHEVLITSLESTAEAAFYAGFDHDGDKMKGWLNYRIEAEL